MVDDLKYIIVTDRDGNEVPVIFSRAFNHDAMYEGVCMAIRIAARHSRDGFYTPEIVSAGFCSADFKSAYGYSETLDLKSRGQADLDALNLGRSPERMEQVREQRVLDEKGKARQHIRDIMLKKDPDTKHLSAARRRAAAEQHAEKHLPEDVASVGLVKLVNDLAGFS